MSKRRKNSGQGYGYMFSGAFSKKADAVAKEKTRKGSFVKSVYTPRGWRYVVMTPRTNPIRRHKRNPSPARIARLNDELHEYQRFIGQIRSEIAGLEAEGGNKRYLRARQRTLAKYEKYAQRLERELGQARENPSELLVMGANPHENVQEIVLQPGSKLVIRNNPADARTNSIGSFFGFSPRKTTKKELAQSRREFKQRVRERGAEMDADLKRMKRAARASQKQTRTARVFHELYGQQTYDEHGLPSNPAICGAMIGGYQCTRKPGHRGPHLPQGATLRPRSRHGWGPRGNPSAEALREKFSGSPVERVQVFNEPHMPAGDYAMLGKLLSPGLYIKPRHGGQVMQITTHGTIMVSDERAHAEDGKLGPIWFVRGDQDVSSGLHHFGAFDRGDGLYELGHLVRVDYQQRKEHVEHPEQDKWKHMLGEETGVRPVVLFDARKKRLLLEGGDYAIRSEGIVN